MAEEKDVAGVIAPPPLLLLIALVIGGVLDLAWPLHILDVAPRVALWIAGGALIAFALWVSLAGSRRFARAGTPVQPWRPSTTLVTDGIFAHVRNPMYLGFLTLTAGLSLVFAGEFLMLAALGLWFALHTGVVRREERYLTARFGDAYRDYVRQVPRYGWRF